MSKWWIAAAAILFILSMDVWNWNQAEPILWFLPYWIWYIVGVVLTTGVLFFGVNKYLWRES